MCRQESSKRKSRSLEAPPALGDAEDPPLGEEPPAAAAAPSAPANGARGESAASETPPTPPQPASKRAGGGRH